MWAPLIGAAAFQIDDWDRRTSDWAREHTPVFGSQSIAEDWSDDLRAASVARPLRDGRGNAERDEPGEWFINKAKGTLVGVAAVSSTVLITHTLKTPSIANDRTATTDESFPSGHTSSSAVHTRLASRNLQSIDMYAALTQRMLNVGLYALTIGTSWSRIEAGWHYPSDTLFSMALGQLHRFVRERRVPRRGGAHRAECNRRGRDAPVAASGSDSKLNTPAKNAKTEKLLKRRKKIQSAHNEILSSFCAFCVFLRPFPLVSLAPGLQKKSSAMRSRGGIDSNCGR